MTDEELKTHVRKIIEQSLKDEQRYMRQMQRKRSLELKRQNIKEKTTPDKNKKVSRKSKNTGMEL